MQRSARFSTFFVHQSPVYTPSIRPSVDESSGTDALNVIGVGLGPANLSLAALLSPFSMVRARFFERKETLRWHAGMLFPDSVMQVHFLKDLVTFVDPNNPYSFLAFLHAKKRLYEFMNAAFPRMPRWQYDEYLRWAAEKLQSTRFDSSVQSIEVGNDCLRVRVGDDVVRTNNVVLGTGLSPHIPSCARMHHGATVVHAIQFLHEDLDWRGKRVAVVGGGQSGAEIVSQLLASDDQLPARVSWVTRRSNFDQLDEAPFANALFTPTYAEWFFGQTPQVRAELLGEQKLASDGISVGLLEKIVQRTYELRYRLGADELLQLMPHRELTDLQRGDDKWELRIKDRMLGGDDCVDADLIVMATGFEYRPPRCLEPLMDRISFDNGNYSVRDDYSVDWDGPGDMRIYVQNAARHARGIADPNLALVSWRSAKIANSLAGRELYSLDDAPPTFS